MNHSFQRSLAGAAACVAWAALVLQMWLTMGIVFAQGRGVGAGLVVYFGYFTLLTNLLGAVCLSAFAIGPRLPGHRSLTHPITVTTAAVAIALVGLVYFLILRHTWKPEGAQFVADAFLHYVTPLLVVIFWWFVVPASAINRSLFAWLFAYPLIYLVYVFVRGEIVGTYPYFFIDAGQIGYAAAFRNSLGMLAAYGAVAGVFTALKTIAAKPRLG